MIPKGYFCLKQATIKFQDSTLITQRLKLLFSSNVSFLLHSNRKTQSSLTSYILDKIEEVSRFLSTKGFHAFVEFLFQRCSIMLMPKTSNDLSV